VSRSAQELKISEAKYSTQREIERTSKAYMRRLVPAEGPLEILDVGCGTGVNAESLRAQGHQVFGIDLSPTALTSFRKFGFAGAVGDASIGLPFKSDRFDLVFSSEVIEHLADGEAFLQELYRVAKPGGRLLLSTPNSAFWVYRVYALLGRTMTEVQHPGHVRFYSVRSLKEIVESCGFQGTKTAARHIYAILFGALPERLDSVLTSLGFHRELRFKTGSNFWHLSRYAESASALWADTLIVTAQKPKGSD